MINRNCNFSSQRSKVYITTAQSMMYVRTYIAYSQQSKSKHLAKKSVAKEGYFIKLTSIEPILLS